MNLFALSGLLIGITSFSFAFFVFLKRPKNRLNQLWAIFAISIGVWGFGAYKVGIITNEFEAFLWWRITHIGIIFIPIFLWHFVYAFLEIKRKKILITVYLIGIFFLIVNLFTNLFIANMRWVFGSFYWDSPPGIFYYPFILFFFGAVIYSLCELIKSLKKSSGIKRGQIKYFLLALIFGFSGGGLSFLPCFKIDFYPYFNYTVVFYPFIMSYAILRYRFMDLRIVAMKTFIYVVSAGFVYGIFYFLVWLYDNFFGGVFITSSYVSGLFIAPVFVLVFIWFYSFIQKIANRYFFYTLYNYQQTINSLSQKLNYINDLNEITSLIVDTVKQSMQLDRAGVLLVLQKEGKIHYRVAKVIGFDEKNGISLVQDNFLTRYLQEKQKPLVREELLMLAKDSNYSEEEKKGFLELESNMKYIEASLCLPLMSNKKLIGIIILGSKISGDAYTKEDIELLSTLSYQAGIAIDNARLYEEIYDLNKNLQQKVDEQTKEIRKAYEVEKKAKEELELLDKSKNQFLLTIQHHLRTPLTSMMGYTDLLLKGAFGKQSAETKKVIGKFKILTDNLIKMVNEFLDITQFQLGKEVIFLKSDVQIGAIVKGIVEELKFEAESKGIYLKLEKIKKIYTVKADEEKLKAGIFNIIDNAIKYTKKGGVTVAIATNFNSILITVKDTGIGIAPENLKNLFNKTFERGEEAKKTFATGRGIGLYIASQIIKAHNGKIWAESEGEGKGSTFYIELPGE